MTEENRVKKNDSAMLYHGIFPPFWIKQENFAKISLVFQELNVCLFQSRIRFKKLFLSAQLI